MDSTDLQVLKTVLAWRAAGHATLLCTVVRTWGSAPRPVGSLMAIRADGAVTGSVSGGCIEDDLIARVQAGELSAIRPELSSYGVSGAEARRFGLPCGGTLQLVLEPVTDTAWIATALTLLGRGQRARRRLDLASGAVDIACGQQSDPACSVSDTHLHCSYGPRYRLLIIGAGQLSAYLAQFALALDYQVTVCDPREEYSATWQVAGVELRRDMPDDCVLAMQPDAHSAIAALTHDPKLDDLALMEALKSPAFYVGALGSRANNARRRERLALFDLTPPQIARLHGPIGLHIGSRTPPEIALSIMAEMTSIRNGIVANTPARAEISACDARAAPVCA